jgi:hypothetical protein
MVGEMEVRHPKRRMLASTEYDGQNDMMQRMTEKK